MELSKDTIVCQLFTSPSKGNHYSHWQRIDDSLGVSLDGVRGRSNLPVPLIALDGLRLAARRLKWWLYMYIFFGMVVADYFSVVLNWLAGWYVRR